MFPRAPKSPLFRFTTPGGFVRGVPAAARLLMKPQAEVPPGWPRADMLAAWEGKVAASTRGVVKGTGVVVVTAAGLPAGTVFEVTGTVHTLGQAASLTAKELKWAMDFDLDGDRRILLPDAPWRYINSCQR